VIGDLSPAVGLDDLDAPRTEDIRIPQDVFVGASASDRVDVRMLQQQQRVTDLTGNTALVQPGLQIGRVRVRRRTEPFDR
jgi:hypothetical protein